MIKTAHIIEDTAAEAEMELSKIKKLVISSKIPLEEILIMTVDTEGISYIARKDAQN